MDQRTRYCEAMKRRKRIIRSTTSCVDPDGRVYLIANPDNLHDVISFYEPELGTYRFLTFTSRANAEEYIRDTLHDMPARVISKDVADVIRWMGWLFHNSLITGVLIDPRQDPHDSQRLVGKCMSREMFERTFGQAGL